MKFYFDGCSYTNGGGVEEHGYDPIKDRWSALVCKHFGAEEYNFACGGASNDCVLRHFFTGQVFQEKRSKVEDIRFDLNDFDFFFIQTTFPSRSEYFSDMKRRWGKMTVNRSSKPQYREKNLRLQEWLDYYYKELYSEGMFFNDDNDALHLLNKLLDDNDYRNKKSKDTLEYVNLSLVYKKGILEMNEYMNNLLSRQKIMGNSDALSKICLLYTSPSPRDGLLSRMPSSA